MDPIPLIRDYTRKCTFPLGSFPTAFCQSALNASSLILMPAAVNTCLTCYEEEGEK